MSSAAATSDAACSSLGATGFSVSVVQGVVLSPSEYQSFQLQAAPFDTGTAVDMFGSGLGLPIVAYVLGLTVGYVRQFLSKGLSR